MDDHAPDDRGLKGTGGRPPIGQTMLLDRSAAHGHRDEGMTDGIDSPLPEASWPESSGFQVTRNSCRSGRHRAT